MPALRLYSTKWCTDCLLAKQFLRETGIDFEDIPIDENEEARKFIVSRLGKGAMVPVFDTGAELFACKPFDAQVLMARLGMVRSEE